MAWVLEGLCERKVLDLLMCCEILRSGLSLLILSVSKIDAKFIGYFLALTIQSIIKNIVTILAISL